MILGKGIIRSRGMLGSGILRGGIIVPPDGPNYDPDALDYFTRAEALDADAFDLTASDAGLTPEAVKALWNTFVLSLKSDSTWDEVDEIVPNSGVSFGAITAKLKHSGTATITLTGFVSGDYLPAGSTPGLKGNGTTKEINSNWVPSDTIIIPSGHHSMFTTEEATVTSREGSGSAADGIFNGFFPFMGDAVYSDMYSVAGGRVSGGLATAGFILANGTATAHRLLLNNSVIATGASPTGSAAMEDYYLFSVGGAGFSDARRSIRTMGQGLTTGQETTLNTAISSLMASLGYA